MVKGIGSVMTLAPVLVSSTSLAIDWKEHYDQCFEGIYLKIHEKAYRHHWVFLNSLNNPKFGASQNLKILIGIPPLDDPMTNLPKKNGWNSLQPPEMELQSLVPTESPSWHHISSRSPGHIHQRIWACHTSLERSRIAFYGYANLCPPNQTIWRLEASKAIQRCPWFAYIRRWDENFSHWVTSYTSLAFRKT